MNASRMKPEDRYDAIVNAGIELAKRGEFYTFTRDDIAQHLDIAPSLVTYYFGVMEALKDAIIVEGCAQEVPAVILVALSEHHPALEDLSHEAKLSALSGG